MADRAISKHMNKLLGSVSGLLDYLNDPVMEGRMDPGAADFVFGNPHEGPLTEYWEALRQNTQPQDNNWYAYKLSEPASASIVSQYLTRTRNRNWPDSHVLMTNGNFAGLAVALSTLVDRGDEVIYLRPPWFFYEVMIRSVGAKPVEVDPAPDTFDLDLDAIESAISKRTRAIIINSPNNPTGRIYPAADLARLAKLLNDASKKHDRPIYLLSDEAYNRIVFDGNTFPSPTDFYDYSLLLYTYGKTLLTPGQRLGYIGLSPGMPDADQVYRGLFLGLMLCGWAFPSALLQHALPDLHEQSVDIAHLQAKRDRMVESLRSFGYRTNHPEGTFYLLAKSPEPDDVAFSKKLAREKVFVLPGQAFEMPGWFRISLTANDEMIDHALPVFARHLQS